MSRTRTRTAAGLTASALALGGLTLSTTSPASAAPGECVAPTTSVNVYSFNDFHGRIEDAAILFTPVEEDRAVNGEDRVLLTSAGDNIGGSTFVSMAGDDIPTSDVMNAAGVEAIAVGNHEFDKGWADLASRIEELFDAPILGANVYDEGTTTVADPLGEFELFEKGGVTIGFIGAVTADLPSLVSPAGISDLAIGDPVQAVNRVAAQLSDGDDANGEADVIIASIHEGAPDDSRTAAENAADSEAFGDMYSDLSADVDVVFNGHTHQVYAWETASGQPILQAGQYGEQLARVTLAIDAENLGLCGTTTEILDPAETPGSQERIVAIQEIVADAQEFASEVGQTVIGETTEAISTPGDGGSDTRNEESPMTNMVAQMFFDKLGEGDDEFIGIQNPGGTRSSFDGGDVTYEEAALTLPFANSLFTTQITGDQFKTVLEQQWQRDGDGGVPSRPFLQLGLSDNVTYTYDESRAEGDRITSISINGTPIVADRLYTVGSGSFLITGGDSFRELANGTNTRDTGRIDLEAWVEWVEDSSPLSPDYTKRGVSVTQAGTELAIGGAEVVFTLGEALDAGAAPQSLDMYLEDRNDGDAISPQLPNTSVTAWIGDLQVGAGTVTDGVGTVTVALVADSSASLGNHVLRFEVMESGTEVFWPVVVVQGSAPGLPSTGV